MIKKTVYSDEDIILHLVYFTEQNLCFIHSEVKKWSLSKYKKYLLVFAEILNQLHKEGIDELFAIPPTEKEEKWQGLFGFVDTGHRIEGYTVMGIKYGN